MKSQRRLSEVISAYWAVGLALRHPDAPAMATGDAQKLLRQSDRLVTIAAEAKLSRNMHNLRYDIIEGNTQWRKDDKLVVHGTVLTLPTKR